MRRGTKGDDARMQFEQLSRRRDVCASGADRHCVIDLVCQARWDG
jgi:hypothetical protein